MAGNDKDSSASGAKSSSNSSSSRSDGPVKVLLGSSFTSASSSSSSKRGNKHFAITHNFKPESIASSYPGALHPPSSSSASAGSSSTAKDWTLEYANTAFLDNPIYHTGDHGNEAESSRTSHHSATAQEAYGYLGRLLQASSSSTANNNSGNSSNHRDVECVLVYDPERGAYILEKLDASFHFKLERGFNGGRLSQTSKTLLEQQQQQREPKQVSKRQRQEGRQRQKPRPSPSPPPFPPPPPARERTTNTATVFSGRETDSRTLRDSRRSRSSSTSSSADSNGTATPIATSPANSFSDNRNEVVAQHAVTSAAAAAAVAAPDSKSRRGGRRRRSESGSQQSALSPTQSIESLTARTATLANSSSNSLLKDVNKKQDSGDVSGGDDSHMTAASAAPTPADGMPDEEDAIMEEVATTPASAPTPSATVHLAAPAGASSTSHHKATAQASGVGSPSVTAIPVTPGIPTIPLGAPAGTVTPGGGTATRPARSTSISTGGTGWQPPTTQSVVVDYRKEDFDDDDEEEEDDEEDSGSGSGSGSGSEDDEEDEDVVGLDLDSFAAELDQEMMVEPPTPIDSRRTSFNLSGAGGGGGAASSSNTASNATVASVRQQLLASQQSGSGSKSGRGAKGRSGGG
ncbi:hypothetical protein OC846_004659 [Tilletia horrida]|uniref:Transcription elongation factor Eaf N-terminal domain-containing protein n=1 Tax=Tilletia horrida TaxID=155126 RepID=A0AAN6JQY3_9BASI|nr:hypothetical protein OC845_005677 [Tilletia horrida]KAK0547972.1 hypothetical protein OC846_004659 [Tilletia horrida]KAK0561733.1 hypothetical protein OC861_005676 [Tilletia horrida]